MADDLAFMAKNCARVHLEKKKKSAILYASYEKYAFVKIIEMFFKFTGTKFE